MMEFEKQKLGRPTKYAARIAKEICERMASGESLRAICRDENMPHRTTVLRWLDTDADFAAKYARARNLQADYLEEEMSDIEGNTLSGAVDAHAASVVLGSKRWRASKLAPKKYGERSHMELTGANGGPVQLSDTERAARVAAILANAQARKDAEGGEAV